MRATFGINVQDADQRQQLFVMLRQMPGQTDLERLQYCLKAGLESIMLNPAQSEKMKEIRESFQRAEDIIVGILQSANVAYEKALAEKDAVISAQSSEITKLEKTIATQVDQLNKMREMLSQQEGELDRLKAALEKKDAALNTAVQQMEQTKKDDTQISDLIQRIGDLEKTTNTLCEKFKDQQTTFV